MPLQWVKKTRVCDNDQQCKDSEKPVKNLDVTRFTVTDQGVMTINPVAPEDAGDYSCIRTLGSEFESRNAKLNVNGMSVYYSSFLIL